MLKLKKRYLGIISIAFAFSSLNLNLPANAIMDGQIVQNSSRVVPIFILPTASDPQPTSTVAFTGFLYSSRIVFTAIPEIGFDGSGNRFTRNPAAIYVGKPGSDISDTSGRVKVVQSFYSKQFRFEDGKLDEFGILVLEKDLITANPFTLLTESMQRELAKTVKITGYGEYRDQCPPGGQPPCREKIFEPSSKPRVVTVSQVSLSEIESLVGYKQPQLRNQMFFHNRANPRAGAVCFGDSGAPIIGEYRFKEVYLGQMSSAVRIYGCGRGEGYDGKGGIHYASPVYRHVELIREAEAFVQAQKKITVKTEEDSSSTLLLGSTSVSLKTTKSVEHENEKVEVVYEGDLSDPGSNPAGFRFFNGYGGDLIQVSQIPMSKAKCSKASATKLRCDFPSFNPYKNILIKKSGVALHVAPYNKAGQGRLSAPVSMFEFIWNSKFGSIDFDDKNKVINDIYGSSLFSKNFGGFISRSTESRTKALFIFQGPPLPKNYSWTIKFSEYKPNNIVDYDTKSVDKWLYHKMERRSYSYENSYHRIEFVSKDKVKFSGDSIFYAEIQIVDDSGLVRGRESTRFTHGYNMKWQCSLGLLGLYTVRDGAKLSLKTFSTAFSAINLYEDLLPVEKVGKAAFLKKFFTDPGFIAERGLAAIEAIEENGSVNFKIYMKNETLDISKDFVEEFGKKVVKESSFGQTSGNAVIHMYNIKLTGEESLRLFINYFDQVDDWNKKNADTIVDVCGKS